MYAKLPSILLNGMHQVILKVINTARKDKACAAVKNYMNTIATPYYDKNDSHSQNMFKDKRRSYEQHSE
jgi:hypothetical protein